MAPHLQRPPRLRYHYPPALIARVAWALGRSSRRYFPADAQRLLGTLQPAPRVEGWEHIPPGGSFVLVFNHYYSPAFRAWWSPIVLTALLQARRPPGGEIRWVMTDAWTYPDPLRSRLLTPITRWAFRRIARLYGFLPMPPMPPRAHEVEARARAVRAVLAAARRQPPPLLGLSPEGHDDPARSLLVPPPGVGRFLLQLAAAGLPFLPAGLYEDGPQLVARFGPPLTLQSPPGLPRGGRDPWAAAQVMVAIGRLLPAWMWGAYSEELARPGRPSACCALPPR